MEVALRVSELSAASGVSVPTIKYYLREGLLPAGLITAPRQAVYGAQHVRRLRLIRALAEVGGLPVAAIRQVLAAIDDHTLSTHHVMGVAHRAAAPVAQARASPELDAARVSVDEFLDGLDWQLSEDAPARVELAHALATLRGLGWDVDARVFDRYAELADRLAAWELERTPQHADRHTTAEAVVVGTVVFGAALQALRRLAQEHHSTARFRRDESSTRRRRSGTT